MIPLILIHILIFDNFLFFCFLSFFFTFSFVFVFFSFVGDRWKSSFLLGVPSLRWLESPRLVEFKTKGPGTRYTRETKSVCVCVCVIDSLRNSFLKHKEGD